MLLARISIALPLLALFLNVPVSAESSIGQQIYHHGLGENGQEITAIGIEGIELKGNRAACSNCHRRSGYGSSEGGMLAPPVIGKLLFRDRDFYYRELDRNMDRPITRPAYTKTSLARALHAGIASNNKSLDKLMPRYALSGNEVNHLAEYLQSMGKHDAVGINKKTIHLATIITPGTNKHEKDAMLATLETYVSNINAATRLEVERARKSPWHRSWKYEAYRKWKLHVWNLEGEPGSWRKQLQQHYRKQPVFAVVSGLGDSTWQPIHDFCENNHIPCLFPSTRFPGRSDAHYYSIYFSEGSRLQTKAVIKHIKQNTNGTKKYTLLQITSKHDRYTADVLSRQLENILAPGLENIEMATMDPDAASKAIAKGQLSNVILLPWLPIPEIIKLDQLHGSSIEHIYMPQTVTEELNSSHKFQSEIFVVRPYTLPTKLERSLLRAKSWAKIHKISPVDTRITANSYFAITLLNKAIKHLRSNFSRNYMIERIEHMLDNNVFHSVYPHLTLGPGQRFASKGCYVIGPTHNLAAISEQNAIWVIP